METEIVIRPARLAERQQLEALQFRASIENPGDRDSILTHPDAIELAVEQIAEGRVFVAEVAGSIEGFAAIFLRPDGDTELDGLFVEPTAWRRGIGRRLVQHCVRIARDQGSMSLHVVGNPHAEAFYAACGFEITGTTDTRFGQGLLMRRLLSGV